MERIKLSKNFYLDEYIPEGLYREFEHKKHILIGLVDKRLIAADQKLRKVQTRIVLFWHLSGESWIHGSDG